MVPEGAAFPVLAAAVAAERGDATALVHGDRRLSYAELHEAAGRVAGGLRQRGVRAGEVVAIDLPRGLEWATAVLGCLRLGAVVCPHGAAPGAGAVISERGDAACADLLAAADAPGDGPGLDDPACLVGGATLTHRDVLDHLGARARHLALGPGDRVAQTAVPTAPDALWQLLAALLVGGTTVICDDWVVRQPARLRRLVAAQGVTVLEAVPDYLDALRGSGSGSGGRLDGLRVLVVSSG